ncbi:hypothetical protein [Methanosarcina siciliae]|uniref:hypothetical protein n=1 Tax=Methanosarcina siciliae TaxID=38027 RepID=UPI0012E00B74|nr:hypothetical protein [Methanosarcina siciliae]
MILHILIKNKLLINRYRKDQTKKRRGTGREKREKKRLSRKKQGEKKRMMKLEGTIFLF